MLTEIVYEDKDVLVVRKPAGLATQTAKVGQQDVVSELKNYLQHSASAFARSGKSGVSGRAASDGKFGIGGRVAGNGKSGVSGRIAGSGKSEPYLGVIHRLDQPVEGLLVFARNRDAARCLTEQLQGQSEDGCISKHYYAVLCGIPAQREGRLTDVLYKESVMVGAHKEHRAIVKELTQEADSIRTDVLPINAGSTSVASANVESASVSSVNAESASVPSTNAEPASVLSANVTSTRVPMADTAPDRNSLAAHRAELEYEIRQVREEERLSLADIRLATGRFHQIRAQMAHAGTPLLGDLKYGSEASKALARRLGIRYVALCACSLEFFHPVSGNRMEFRIEPKNPAFSFFSQL